MRYFLLFVIAILSPVLATSQVIFTDDFNNLSNWTLYGSPLPNHIDSIYGRTGIFDNNGDPNYNSGAISKTTFDISNGFVLESDVYLDFYDPTGCWADAEIGIADPEYKSWGGYDPSIAFDLSANGDACWGSPERGRHSYLTGGYMAATGWEGFGPTTADTLSYRADKFTNGWHTLKIAINQDKIPSYYIDDSLIYIGTSPVLDSIMTSPRALWLGARSSGSAGKTYHDNISLSAMTHPPVSFTERIFFSKGSATDKDIFMINPDGSGLTPVIQWAGSDERMVRISPDGKKIAFQSNKSGKFQIWVANIDGTGAYQLTNTSIGAYWNFCWYPDNQSIMFDEAVSSTTGRISRIRLDGTDYQVMIGNVDASCDYHIGGEINLVDTNMMVYQIDHCWGPSSNFYLHNFHTNSDTLIFNGPGGTASHGCGRLSPDGSKFVFFLGHAGLDNGYDLVVMNSNGTNRRAITSTNDQEGYFMPGWSPDGNSIVSNYFPIVASSIHYLVTMNADGSNRHQIFFDSTSWVGYPEWARITTGYRLVSVKDVPHDQGEKVSLNWQASSLDTNTSALSHYSIWRAVPQGSVQKSEIVLMNAISGDFKGTAYRVTSINGTTYFWEWIANQPAHRFFEYSYTASTLYDSMSTTNGKHYFLISAHTSDPNIFYDSNIDSGYSVDNLAPLAPKGFAASFTAGQVIMHWNANVESDLHSYVLFRGSSPANLAELGTTSDTQYVDQSPISGNGYYAVRAMDIHENLSPFSNTIITGVADEDQKFPREYALNQNYPNPFNPSTTIKYALPQASHVNLSVFNTLGQRVALLVDGKQEAGYHEVNFDASGLTSGVYFYRLQAVEYTETKKLILMK